MPRVAMPEIGCDSAPCPGLRVFPTRRARPLQTVAVGPVQAVAPTTSALPAEPVAILLEMIDRHRGPLARLARDFGSS